MMKIGLAVLAVVGLSAVAVPVLADQTDVLYNYKNWQVVGVTADDGTFACLAEVSEPGESFSIWTFPDSTIRLQFYSEDWDFGDSSKSDLKVEIDRRGAWTVPDATLTEHSVLYDLPDEKESVNFIVEVARGSTLHLRSADDTPVKDYSLSGSSASISYLIDCGKAISSSKNPFN